LEHHIEHADFALRAVDFILAIGAVVFSMEFFAIRDSLCDEGMLSWRVHRLSLPRITLRIIAGCGLDHLFAYRFVIILLATRVLAAITFILLNGVGWSGVVPLSILAATALMFTLRNPQGNDGSDQMATIILVASTLSRLVGTTFSVRACLVFIAAEASLAYGTSGLLKIVMKEWRDGTFVTEILKTSSYGNRRLLEVFKNRRGIAIFAGWAVCMGDCSLSSAALLPPEFCLSLLAFGVALHFGIATVLGLNTFVWSFVATFPAILWCSVHLYSTTSIVHL
jgi:hypothetical protein